MYWVCLFCFTCFYLKKKQLPITLLLLERHWTWRQMDPVSHLSPAHFQTWMVPAESRYGFRPTCYSSGASLVNREGLLGPEEHLSSLQIYINSRNDKEKQDGSFNPFP